MFRAILANATRLCDATFGLLLLYEGDWHFRVVAMSNAPPAFAELRQREPLFEVSPQTALGRAVATKDVVHIADYSEEAIYKERHPAAVALGELGGARTFFVVPMLKNGEIIGAIAIYRQVVQPFTDKQIELVQNFAAQAVIAIENARLLNELRQSTMDLTEALEQQTATSEVLQVISSSPSELEPVFATMLEKAVRICDAKFGNVYRWDGDAQTLVATHNTPPAFAEARRSWPFLRPGQKSVTSRMLATKAVVHVADAVAQEGYADRSDPAAVAAVELAGVRTFLAVPMLREDELIGSLTLYRQAVLPFTEKQIALVQNFAAQAVIAIENARLLNELRQRTDDLTEALEQQTATSEVLQVISSSPGELDPVFAAMLGSATRICEAEFGNFFLREGETFRAVAWHGEPTYVENWRQQPLTIKTEEPHIPLARLVETKQRVHVADLRKDVAYTGRFYASRHAR